MVPVTSTRTLVASQDTSLSQNGEHDTNFNLPLPLFLETARVRLTPYIPSIHGKIFFSAFKAAPELSHYLPVAFDQAFIESFILSDPASVLFTIIDKTKGEGDLTECLAGIIGLMKCSPIHLLAEIGPIIILPKFQRSFVSSNAIGALLKFLLNIPSEGGKGFRRVQWTADPDNQSSVRAAERMGLKREGLMRWTWCVPEGRVGRKTGEGRGERLGRDSVILAICWNDWEDGGRESVENIINMV